MIDSDKCTHIGFYGIINNDDFLLVVRKSRGPYKGLFDLPGGRPQYGEPILNALSREIKEETGIEAKTYSLYDNFSFFIHYADSAQKKKSMYHIALIYNVIQFDKHKFDPKIASEDVNGCIWINKEELSEEQCSPVLKSVLIACKKN